MILITCILYQASHLEVEIKQLLIVIKLFSHFKILILIILQNKFDFEFFVLNKDFNRFNVELFLRR